MALGGLITRFKNQYDKLLAFLVLLGLLGSLLFLAVRVGFMKSTTEQILIQIDSVRAAHEKAAVVDTLDYQQAERTIENPYRLPVWTNSLLVVPETRVWCVDCRQPILYMASNCTFCLSKQPKPRKDPPDIDEDGMLTIWEIKFGLNPRDPEDAGRDPDGDKFTNLEEHNAATDPTDEASCPDIIVKLRVRKVAVRTLSLRFDGKVKVGEGAYKFQVNHKVAGRTRTYFVKLGEIVGNTEFVAERYEEKIEMVNDPTMGRRRKDASVLYLKLGDKTVDLTYKQDRPWQEAGAILYLDWESDAGDQPEYRVEVGSVFELEGDKYEVIAIDSDKGTVVVKRERDGRQFTVAKSPAGGEVGAGE